MGRDWFLRNHHPDREALLAILRRQIEAVKKYQDPSGMWRQVLDHPESWEETSCPAMFAYGIARAVNRGWIGQSDMAAARKAFTALARRVKPDGRVDGTCQGTGIGRDLIFYLLCDRPPDDIHGHGAVMLAGAEILAGAGRSE